MSVFYAQTTIFVRITSHTYSGLSIRPPFSSLALSPLSNLSISLVSFLNSLFALYAESNSLFPLNFFAFVMLLEIPHSLIYRRFTATCRTRTKNNQRANPKRLRANWHCRGKSFSHRFKNEVCSSLLESVMNKKHRTYKWNDLWGLCRTWYESVKMLWMKLYWECGWDVEGNGWGWAKERARIPSEMTEHRNKW